MKAAVFLDGYLPHDEVKDPGLIPLGLNRIGCDTCLVTLTKPQLTNYSCPFSLISAQEERFKDAGFWRGLEAAVVICYTWLRPSYNPILEKILASEKKIVIKADTDGRLGYPVMPRYIRDPNAPSLGNLTHWFRHTRAFGRFSVSHKTGYRATMPERMKQIQLSSAVIIESPRAIANVSRVLDYWGRADLKSKLQLVPNPVAEDVVTAGPRTKQDLVLSAARWDAPTKNASVMLSCLKTFLRKKPRWRARLVGPTGSELLNEAVSRWDRDLSERIEILGFVSRQTLVESLADSRIFFAPSMSEGFGIAAAEAACMGCTIVGTPLECFEFLAANGFSGTLSDGFAANQIEKALESDAAKHVEGAYDPLGIAAHWRSKLSFKQVSAQIYEIIREL